MTLDSLLAIIGLGVAAYQIMPRARQLDLWVRLHVFDIVVIAAGGLAIGYLQFYPVFAALGLSFHPGLSRWELTPERLSFVVFLLVFLTVTVHLRSSRLPRRSVPRLRDLVEELLWNDAPEATLVIEHHLPRVRQFAKSETRLERIRKWAMPTREEELLEITRLPSLDNAESAQPSKSLPHGLQRFVRKVLRPIKGRFADQRPGNEDALWLLSRVQRSREFARVVAARRPYLGIAFMSDADRDTHEFMRYYFEALLNDPASVLHRELRDNDTGGGGRLRDFVETDRLLTFLLKDPNVAERLHVYQPVGDSALAKLQELARDPASDEYNLSADHVFRERGCWSTFLYPVVSFFDLMISSSLHAGVHWHMWLLYYAEFTDRMIENHAPRGGITEPDSFYQTRYTYLIYEMISRNRDWVLAVHEVRDQPHIADVQVNFEYENDNIPKTSIICLIRMLSSILVAPSLPDTFRHRIAEMVFKTYFKLRACGGCEKYAEILLIGLREGYFSYDPVRDRVYQAELRAAFATFDTIPYMMNGHRRGATMNPLADFRQALNL